MKYFVAVFPRVEVKGPTLTRPDYGKVKLFHEFAVIEIPFPEVQPDFEERQMDEAAAEFVQDVRDRLKRRADPKTETQVTICFDRSELIDTNLLVRILPRLDPLWKAVSPLYHPKFVESGLYELDCIKLIPFPKMCFQHIRV